MANKEIKVTPPAPEPSKYTREELVENAQTVFEKMPEIVSGAFYESDKTEYTIAEAKELIEKFLKRKVKN